MGILDWITESAKKQYAKGEPYRQALGGLLQGDMNKVNQSLAKSDLTPTDVAMSFAPLGITAWHGTNKLFNPSDILPSTSGTYGQGVYLAERPTTAAKYGETLLKYDIPEQNLFDVYGMKSNDYKKLYKDAGIKYNSKVDDYLRLGAKTNAFQEAQKDLGDISKHGYEGVKGYSEFGGDEYLLFNPKKLKPLK